MSLDAPEFVEIGNVSVFTTNNRSATIDELAERALDKIIYIGENVPFVIREQALAYRASLRGVLVTYMREAVRCDRSDIARKHPEFAPILNL